MAKIKQFEELPVWKSARELAKKIYEQTSEGDFSKDFALRDQIRKAAISVMSNVAEGFDAGYDREFIRFLGFSFRSAAEVQSQLYTALDQGYLKDEEFQACYDQSVDVRKQIRGLISYLSTNTRQGRVAREQGGEYLGDPAFDSEYTLDLPDFLIRD